jgi:hypothetical protein
MNKRIKELAKQLGYNVNFKPSDDETDRGYQVVSNDFAEKFAELIVRECAGIAYEYDIPNLTGPGEFIGNRMKKHFGVKE